MTVLPGRVPAFFAVTTPGPSGRRSAAAAVSVSGTLSHRDGGRCGVRLSRNRDRAGGVTAAAATPGRGRIRRDRHVTGPCGDWHVAGADGPSHPAGPSPWL